MKKLTVKNIVDFRRKSESSKNTFVRNLKVEKRTIEGSGGDYWISCSSAIKNAFLQNNLSLLDDKVDLLGDKIKYTKDERVKTQFERNIDLLKNFREFDFSQLKPKFNLNIHIQPKENKLLRIKGFPVEAAPSKVFSYEENGVKKVGGVWFVAKLDGYKKGELGIFSEVIYKYLEKHFSNDFQVEPKYCIAVDLFKAQKISYSEIKKGNVDSLISSTLDEMKRYS